MMLISIRRQHRGLSLIASPIDEKDGESPHFCRHSDATPIELFFDLFFVANLSSFTATHEINNVEGMLGSDYDWLGLSNTGVQVLEHI